MLTKLNNYIQQKIQENYHENTYEDAAFMTFLDVIYNTALLVFVVVSYISVYLFTKLEIIPAISKLVS